MTEEFLEIPQNGPNTLGSKNVVKLLEVERRSEPVGGLQGKRQKEKIRSNGKRGRVLQKLKQGRAYQARDFFFPFHGCMLLNQLCVPVPVPYQSWLCTEGGLSNYRVAEYVQSLADACQTWIRWGGSTYND